MKNVLLSAAALAVVVSSPAFAASNGGDGRAAFNIRGTASDYCVLGKATTGSTAGGHNVTVDVSTFVDGYNGTTSDAKVDIVALQTPGDHAASWKAVVNLQKSVCNVAYTVKANSANGGLLYAGTTAADPAFFTKTAYSVQVSFGGQTSAATNAGSLIGGNTLLSSTHASAGNFKIVLDGNADNSKFLLSGEYKDRVLVTLAPTV